MPFSESHEAPKVSSDRGYLILGYIYPDNIKGKKPPKDSKLLSIECEKIEDNIIEIFGK